MTKLVFISLFIFSAIMTASPIHYGYIIPGGRFPGQPGSVGVCSATEKEWKMLSEEFIRAFEARDANKSGTLEDYIAHIKPKNSDQDAQRLINYKKFLNEQLQELDELEGDYYCNVYNLLKVLAPIYLLYGDWHHLCLHEISMEPYWNKKR